MIKNLPLLLLIAVAVYLVYSTSFGQYLKNAVSSSVDAVEHTFDQDTPVAQTGPKLDLGMYDIPNDMAFGTTQEAERRITNDGVRKEYHNNPFPWAECSCASGQCDMHGVPDPTPGQTHVCRNGFPSKRVVDMYGGHFQLNHMCAPGLADDCSGEPAVLGRWFCRKGCSNAESVGLNVRSACTRCA